MHHLIYITGLGDINPIWQRRALRLYRLFGIDAELYQMNWANTDTFSNKQKKLLARIDTLAAKGETVALVGVSAGATAVTAAYSERREKISAVIFICGKLAGTADQHYYDENPAFYSAMQMLPGVVKNLTSDDKKKMISYYSLYDPIVPAAQTRISSVPSHLIPMIGHGMTIATGLVFYSPIIAWRIKVLSRRLRK